MYFCYIPENELNELVRKVLESNEYNDNYSATVLDISKIYKRLTDRNGIFTLTSMFKRIIADKINVPSVVELIAQDIVNLATKPEHTVDFDKYSFVFNGTYDRKSFRPMKLTVGVLYSNDIYDDLEVIYRKLGIKGAVQVLKYLNFIDKIISDK